MNETKIILIVSLALFTTTIGVYGVVKLIQNNTSSPFNTLSRRGDIELNNFIEPSLPEQAHLGGDLLNHQFERIQSELPQPGLSNHWTELPQPGFSNNIHWTDIPSNFSKGTSSITRFHIPTNPSSWDSNTPWIDSCLEKNINLEIILLIFIIMILIIYYFLSRVKRNNENKIVFTEGISTNIITFTEDYQDLLSSKITDGINYDIVYEKTEYYSLPHYWTLFNIKDWLDSLNVQDYAVTFHLSCVPSEDLYYNTPEIILTKEIMINKSSNPALISVLLYQQLDYFYNSFNIGYYENHTILIRYKALTASP